MMSFLAAVEGVGQTFMWIWWGLWVVLFIVLILVLIKHYRQMTNPVMPQKSAIDILKERYARSEISKQEFDDRKRDLSV
jgi:putative membrane protein